MNWFKKYFVPHRENSYRPHLFREAGIAMLFLFIVGTFALALSGRFILTHTDLTALVLPKVLVDYANDDRTAQHYSQLTINPVLERAAQLKANDMAEKGYFAHKSPDGHTPWYWFDQAGYDFTYAGENLAVNFDDSIEVNTAWMNSPGHKANILNPNFTEIGIATAEGMYQGRRTVFVVQLFGRPALADIKPVFPKPVTTVSASAKVAKVVLPKVSTTSKVAGASTTEVVLSESVSTIQMGSGAKTDLYIAVKKESPAALATTEEHHSTLWERIVTSPKKFLGFMYLFLAIVILVGLVTMLCVEIRKQNPMHILLALSLLVLISGLLFMYQSVFFAQLYIV